MHLLILHTDSLAGYTLTRHLHEFTPHRVLAVVTAATEVAPLLQRHCHRESGDYADGVLQFGFDEQFPLPVLRVPSDSTAEEAVEAVRSFARRVKREQPENFLYRELHLRLLRRLLGEEQAAFTLLPTLDFQAAWQRVSELQGPSPEVLRQVYEELKTQGKLL